MRTKHASLISGVDAVAVGYSLGHLTALKNFVGNDRIDARSNTAERGVRGVANGRGRSHGGRDVHTAADRQAERDQPAAPPALRPRAHRPPERARRRVAALGGRREVGRRSNRTTIADGNLIAPGAQAERSVKCPA